MAKQTARHFGGNKKAAPVGRGGSMIPKGSGSVPAAVTARGAAVGTAIPAGRSAVKKGGGKVPMKAKKGTNMGAKAGGFGRGGLPG